MASDRAAFPLVGLVSSPIKESLHFKGLHGVAHLVNAICEDRVSLRAFLALYGVKFGLADFLNVNLL